MRVQIAARHCEIPTTIRTRTEEQLGRLVRYEPRLSSAEVVFDVEKHTKLVEAVLSVDRDEPVVASGEGAEFKTAVDQMVDRLSRILRRRRDRVRGHGRRSSEGAIAGE